MANVAIVAEVLRVFEVAQHSRKSRLKLAYDARNLRTFARHVFTDNYLEVAEGLSEDRFQQRNQMMRSIVGRNAYGKERSGLSHALSQVPVVELKTLIGLAGAPATIVFAGTTPRTTEFAPTIAPAPIVAGPRMIELSPTQTFSPMMTGPPPPSSRWAGGWSGLLCCSPL